MSEYLKKFCTTWVDALDKFGQKANFVPIKSGMHLSRFDSLQVLVMLHLARYGTWRDQTGREKMIIELNFSWTWTTFLHIRKSKIFFTSKIVNLMLLYWIYQSRWLYTVLRMYKGHWFFPKNTSCSLYVRTVPYRCRLNI